MPETTRTQLAVYAVVLCAIVWLGARYLGREQAPAPTGSTAADRATAPEGIAIGREGGGRVTVHVAGEVRRPGVYRLREGARVQAAVRAAGGATSRAQLDGVNLASKAQDGRQIVVPPRVPPGTGSAAGPAAGAGAAAAGGGAGAPPGAPALPIDLNTATLEQLDTLDGVGPATAQKILEFREEKGGFGSVEELGQVPGIGEKRMATLRERVRV